MLIQKVLFLEHQKYKATCPFVCFSRSNTDCLQCYYP